MRLNRPPLLGHRPSGLKTPPPQIKVSHQTDSPPFRMMSVVSSPMSDTSTISIASSGSNFSRSPSESSSASSVPSLGLNQQRSLNEEIMHRDYDLPCILRDIVRCPATFTGEGYQYWVEHSISHYRNSDPPTYARCIFCDKTFCSNNAWQRRMSHIADHFERGKSIDVSRPDFWVLKDMREKGDLSREQYDVCLRGCERPPVAGLRPLDWEPEEVVARREAEAERANQIRVPLRREQRHSRPR